MYGCTVTVACHCFNYRFRVSIAPPLRLSLFVIIFSPRPFPSINKKFLNFYGHQVATGVRSARVARIQRQNQRSLSLTVELYRGDLKKTILAITHLQLRMIYLTPMRENNVKPQRSRATLVARKFIAHRKRASNGARCVIRWFKDISL